MAHADRVGSSIVLANDPDADRFCAAEKVDGKWNVFTGDQLGTLFGAWVLRKYKESGKPIGEHRPLLPELCMRADFSPSQTNSRCALLLCRAKCSELLPSATVSHSARH